MGLLIILLPSIRKCKSDYQDTIFSRFVWLQSSNSGMLGEAAAASSTSEGQQPDLKVQRRRWRREQIRQSSVARHNNYRALDNRPSVWRSRRHSAAIVARRCPSIEQCLKNDFCCKTSTPSCFHRDIVILSSVVHVS